MLQNAASEAFDNKYYVSNTVSNGITRSCLRAFCIGGLRKDKVLLRFHIISN